MDRRPLKYPTTSETLLNKVAAGDECGWRDFYAGYAPLVKAVAGYKGLDAAEAEDLCQQVMLQFFKQSGSFKFDPGVARCEPIRFRGRSHVWRDRENPCPA